MRDALAVWQELTAVADYVVPNYTETACIANVAYQKDGMSKEEAKALVIKLREIGAKSVVITSALVDADTRRRVSTIGGTSIFSCPLRRSRSASPAPATCSPRC